MFRFALLRSLIRRFGRGLPVVELLLVAEVGLMAGRHVAKLDRAQRRRLIALMRQARGRPSSLRDDERAELRELVATMEPRLLFGSAVKRLLPLPVPKRLLYGRRGSRARRAGDGNS